MQTKIAVLLLILLNALPCLAQQPRIDSIAVDEDKGELVLHGDFQNSASAIVLVDSVSLPVTSTSDTLIRATIPVSGKGAVGWVSITSNSNQSNKKLLTYIHFYVAHCLAYQKFSQTYDYRDYDSIHIRANFSDFKQSLIIISSKLSRFYYYSISNGTSIGTLTASVIFNPTTKQLIYNLGNQGFGLIDTAIIELDNSFTPIFHFAGGGGCGEIGVEGFYWGSIAPTNFPPSNAGVYGPSLNPSILQAHLNSDPILSNEDIIITLQYPKNVQLQILDILGHTISSDVKMLQAGENKLPINSSALPSGMYICRLQAGGEVVSVRFVKE